MGEIIMEQRIVCAAIRNKDGDIVCSPRHFDALTNRLIRDCVDDCIVESFRRVEQGFVDQKGKFLTRTEAWHIAVAANQISRRVGGDDADGGTLYSENLY